MPVVWRASRAEDALVGMEGKEREVRGGRPTRRENGRRMVVEPLSTGSLGHSYASAVGTITAKPRRLHKTPRPRVRPNDSPNIPGIPD